MTVRAEEVSSVADTVRLTIRGMKLPNKDSLFGKSDPYFTIARLREDNQWQQVCMRLFVIFHTPHLCIYHVRCVRCFRHACLVVHIHVPCFLNKGIHGSFASSSAKRCALTSTGTYLQKNRCVVVGRLERDVPRRTFRHDVTGAQERGGDGQPQSAMAAPGYVRSGKLYSLCELRLFFPYNSLFENAGLQCICTSLFF